MIQFHVFGGTCEQLFKVIAKNSNNSNNWLHNFWTWCTVPYLSCKTAFRPILRVSNSSKRIEYLYFTAEIVSRYNSTNKIIHWCVGKLFVTFFLSFCSTTFAFSLHARNATWHILSRLRGWAGDISMSEGWRQVVSVAAAWRRRTAMSHVVRIIRISVGDVSLSWCRRRSVAQPSRDAACQAGSGRTSRGRARRACGRRMGLSIDNWWTVLFRVAESQRRP